MPELVVILLRSIIAFLLLFLMARIMGKKQISQLTFFDYCVGITIGSIAATMSVDQNVKALNGIMSLFIWGLFPILLAYLGMKSNAFSKLADGKPTTLIKNGEVLEGNMKKNLLNLNELMLLLREQNVFKVSDVEMAVLETNGGLSVMLKTDKQPVHAKMLGIPVEQEHGPNILIMDGTIMEKSIEKLGYTAEWLLGEVQKQGANEIQDVFMAQIDSRGELYVDLYEEKNKLLTVEERALLGSSLKKIQADLESFALETENQQAKKMYAEQANHLEKLLASILPYLK
ncbi:DUF421 domain-containing protein [Virgibacillus sp. NKC19-3]|uniref:DUF421 domain-containing protein n=1 Tax=Virgibacillus saliphilus TaxID=2831674 RepID=UPI001C9AE9C6|nr:DUF421 domain-containing protein [Virgibacillus sp. NKC19-3]MBY7142579.1 DUF421 domain-containing protein [Virgibacillus sp. NKC19-3]